MYNFQQHIGWRMINAIGVSWHLEHPGRDVFFKTNNNSRYFGDHNVETVCSVCLFFTVFTVKKLNNVLEPRKQRGLENQKGQFYTYELSDIFVSFSGFGGDLVC